MTMHRYYTPFGPSNSPVNVYHLNEEYNKDFTHSTYTLCIFNSYDTDTTINEIVDDLESWDTLTFLGTETCQVGNERRVYYVFSTEPTERNPIRSYIHLPVGKMAAFEREMNIIECTYACVPLPILARGAASIYQEMYRTNKLSVEESYITINDMDLPCYAVIDGITTIMSAVELFDDHMVIPEYQVFVSDQIIEPYDEYFTINREDEFDEKLHKYITNLYK